MQNLPTSRHRRLRGDDDGIIPNTTTLTSNIKKLFWLRMFIHNGYAFGLILLTAISFPGNAQAEMTHALSKKEIVRIHEKSWANLDKFYFGQLFSKELREFLKQQMHTLKKISRWNGLALSDFQKTRQEREQRLIHLFKSTYSNMNQIAAGGIEVPHILHRWSASSKYPGMAEILDWYQYRANRKAFGRVSAEDWHNNPDELVEEAVKKALSKYPQPPKTSQELSRQLAFILLHIHERFWRGKALRLLGYKIYKLHQKLGDIPELEYLDNHLAGIFESNDVIWNQYSKISKHQRALAKFFTIIKHHPTPAKKAEPEGHSISIYLPVGVALVAVSVAYSYFFGRAFLNTGTQDSDEAHDSPPPVTPAMPAPDFPPEECAAGTILFPVMTSQLPSQTTQQQKTETQSITTTRETDSEDQGFLLTPWSYDEDYFNTWSSSYDSGSNYFGTDDQSYSDNNDSCVEAGGIDNNDDWVEGGESEDDLYAAEAVW